MVKKKIGKGRYTASKGRQKFVGLREFDARHFASVGGWKVTGFEKPKKRRKK